MIRDIEATSLAAAVAALGDDQGRYPGFEEIAERRRAETRQRAIAVVQEIVDVHYTVPTAWTAKTVIEAIESAGLLIVARRPA